MKRLFVLFFACLVTLSACGPVVTTADGTRGVAKINRISSGETSRIQFRMVDSINALRQASGLSNVKLNAQLNAAAATHSRDMSVQNRPWHFGSDGSSPLDRVARSGYRGTLVGENISETFETELETLSAWMETPETRDVILDPRARDLGFSWFQEPSGKIWWTLISGAPSRVTALPAS